jgi:seryl-tRNA synthetase
MSTEPENTKLPDPFDMLNEIRDSSLKAWMSMRDASLETWSKMMIELVNSEAYSKTTAQELDSYLTLSQPLRQLIDMTTTQVLIRLNMPPRADVTQIAERLTNIEVRLDDLDTKLDEIQHAIATLSAPKHAVSTAKTKGEAH